MSGVPVPFVSPDMSLRERLVTVMRARVARASIDPAPQHQFYNMCLDVESDCTCSELAAALEYVQQERNDELASRGASCATSARWRWRKAQNNDSGWVRKRVDRGLMREITPASAVEAINGSPVVIHQMMFHDEWCAVNYGGGVIACNCAPTVRYFMDTDA